MVKVYLNKFFLLLLVALLFCGGNVKADDNYSELFIKVTDATTALNKGNRDEVRQIVEEIKAEFDTFKNIDSKAGQEVRQSLNIQGEIQEKNLVQISAALLAFEKEQHPMDIDAGKTKLVNKLKPLYEKLSASIAAKDLNQVREDYKKLNNTWTANEAVVRDTSSAHYGAIETKISFLRSSIETEPTDFTAIQTSFEELQTAINQFIKGEEVASQHNDLTLTDGITLLKTALTQFQSGDKKQAAANMKEFITIWPSIEGDVSTRNPSLYTRVESESPVIMVRGEEKDYQDKLETLIADLSSIDTNAQYNFFDASLILLREGVEALLIIMALVTTLKASKQRKGLIWVYSGATLGMLASALVAVLLQSFFPVLASGANREMIEGLVGIFAVIMMVLIGIWLHSKSSVKKWNDFMQAQMKVVTATGSFISMFTLSFLAVFREGAETILFYVGILPRIHLTELILGISLAISVLAILALIMTKASHQFKPHRIFLGLTWMIYALAFKMLGVSIHALQLTNILPSHLIKEVPTIDLIGLYPNVEVLVCQFAFLIIVLWVSLKNREQKHG